jgi:hypothetical protein
MRDLVKEHGMPSSVETSLAVKSAPKATTFIQHVKDTTDFARACRKVRRSRPPSDLISFHLAQEVCDGLLSAARDAIRTYGLHGWLSKDGRLTAGTYDSLSLTSNPDLRDPGITDVHQSTLGTSVNRDDEFFYGATHRFSGLKHTYFDTYGFRQPTPAARTGFLGEFLSQCSLSLVRSRLSVLRAGPDAPLPFHLGWHRDEPVFENLRINIPLCGSPDYLLQLEHVLDQPDEASQSMSSHYLEPGRGYTFDTHRPHRVYAARPTKADRIHLVLGFSPWFSYDAEADSWSPNEHYGATHPFDIVCGGGLHPAIRLDTR